MAAARLAVLYLRRSQPRIPQCPTLRWRTTSGRPLSPATRHCTDDTSAPSARSSLRSGGTAPKGVALRRRCRISSPAGWRARTRGTRQTPRTGSQPNLLSLAFRVKSGRNPFRALRRMPGAYSRRAARETGTRSTLSLRPEQVAWPSCCPSRGGWSGDPDSELRESLGTAGPQSAKLDPVKLGICLSRACRAADTHGSASSRRKQIIVTAGERCHVTWGFSPPARTRGARLFLRACRRPR